MHNEGWIRTRILRDSNLFVFASTLAEVRKGTPHVDTIRNTIVRASGESLTSYEYNALHRFQKHLRKNYNLVEGNFIRFSGAQAFTGIARVLGKRVAADLIDALGVLSPRFERFWKKEMLTIKKVDRYIRRYRKPLRASLAAIERLCGLRRGRATILASPINLVFGGTNEKSLIGWYSSFENKHDLVLAYSPKRKPSPFLLGVLLHETMHLALHANTTLWHRVRLFARKHRRTLQRIDRTKSPGVILEECLLSVFAPEGVLMNDYFDRKVQRAHWIRKGEGTSIGLTSIRRYCAWVLQADAREYLIEKKRIDGTFLQLLLQKIEKG